MIWERLLIAVVLFMVGYGAYTLFKQNHLRALGRVMASNSRPTLLYFKSDNCAGCPTQSRYLDQLRQLWVEGISIQKIDADVEPEKAAEYGVFTLPTTILVNEAGAVKNVNYGVTNAHKLVQQLRNLN